MHFPSFQTWGEPTPNSTFSIERLKFSPYELFLRKGARVQVRGLLSNLSVHPIALRTSGFRACTSEVSVRAVLGPVHFQMRECRLDSLPTGGNCTPNSHRCCFHS